MPERKSDMGQHILYMNVIQALRHPLGIGPFLKLCPIHNILMTMAKNKMLVMFNKNLVKTNNDPG